MMSKSIYAGMVLFLAAGSVARGAIGDTSADAVLGQTNFTDNEPNQPSGAPTASNLALSNAAHLAIAPDGRLYVADVDNHRVLSWPSARSFSTGDSADLVIGQPNFTSAIPNNGGLSASSLFLPQGLCVDEAANLWVVDAFNNRVLKFNNPTSDATPFEADLVIGQPDFTSNAPNLGGGFIGNHVATADSLVFPGRVLVRGQSVWIADAGNSRVLHYTNPTTNKPFADRVLGQYGDFTCRVKNNDGTCTEKFGDAPNADNLFNAIGLALAPDGTLYVADWNNHRVLRYDDPLGSDATADGVIGQPDLDSGDPNNGGLAMGLQLPIDVAVDGTGSLYVADAGNNRVLVYHHPKTDDIADAVFGQLDNLSTGDANHGLGFFMTDADGLFGASGLAVDSGCNVYIADTENSRVLRFDAPLRLCGDMNCDGELNLADVEAFVLALLDADAFAMTYKGCPVSNGDMNQDGEVDAADVRAFIWLVVSP